MKYFIRTFVAILFAIVLVPNLVSKCSAAESEVALELEFELTGTITEQTAKDFTEYVKQLPEGNPIVIINDSNGGSFNASTDIIKAMKEHGNSVVRVKNQVSSGAATITANADIIHCDRPTIPIMFHTVGLTINYIRLTREIAEYYFNMLDKAEAKAAKQVNRVLTDMEKDLVYKESADVVITCEELQERIK